MTLSEIVSPVRTAILLVDLQRDFLSPDGVLGKAGQDVTRMRKVIEPIKMLLDRARKLSIPILFTQFIDSYQYRNAPGKHMFEKKELTEDHLCCLEGSVGAEFFDIVPKKEDEIIVKRSYDSFDGTSLEKNLRERYIQTLIIGGVKTNACVETTIRTAYHKGFYTVIPSECVASNTEREHEASLFNISRYFGDVVSFSELLGAWRAESY